MTSNPFFHDPDTSFTAAPEPRLEEAPELEEGAELALPEEEVLVLIIPEEPPTRELAAAAAETPLAARAVLTLVAESKFECAPETPERASEAVSVA